jgi:hypothetical protein
VRRGALVVAAALASAGCGGGLPLLHPARTLPTGDVRMASGVSANVAVGSPADDLSRARDLAARDPTVPGAPGTNPDYAKGALVAASLAPGLAPFVGARVGVGEHYEGGLAYTGRAVRVDMRRAWGGGPWSVSVGLGAAAALYGRQPGTDLPNVDLGALHGWGADLPLLVGWQSAAGLYEVWAGPRLGYERDTLEILTSEPKSVTIGTPPIHLESDRFWGGGVVGAATGFRHVHVGVELDVAYQILSGSYNQTSVTVRGVTLAPATSLWWTF